MHCFIHVRWWLIRPVPLLPASCDLFLSIGEGIVEELCRSSAAPCTASLLHLHKIDSGFLVKCAGQDWLSFHLQFDWTGRSWLSVDRIDRLLYFLVVDDAALCRGEIQLAVRHRRGRSGLFLKSLLSMIGYYGKRETDPCVCQHNIQGVREEEILCIYPPFSSVGSFCVFAQRNHSDD